MPLPSNLFRPAFQSHHLGRSFSVIVGIMVFIASFAASAEAGLTTLAFQWGQTMDSRLTVEIPAVGDEASMSQAERVKQATGILRAMPEIQLVMPLSDDEVEHLLQPWFNEPQVLKSLPLPTLIDVERKDGATLSAEKIQQKLKDVISNVRVDDHGAWTQDVWRLVRGLSLLSGLTITLTALTLMIAVSLICRSVTASERENIALLHMLVAIDSDIARLFQLQAQRLAWKAALTGFSLAMLVTFALVFATRHIVDVSTLTPQHWVGLSFMALLVPSFAIGLSGMAARVTALRLLRAISR